MPTTPRGYRYPVGSDAPAGPLQLQRLAEDVDADTKRIRDRAEALRAQTIIPYYIFASNGKVPSGTLIQNIVIPAKPYTRRYVVMVLGDHGFDTAVRSGYCSFAQVGASTVAQPTSLTTTAPANGWTALVGTMMAVYDAGAGGSISISYTADGLGYFRGVAHLLEGMDGPVLP